MRRPSPVCTTRWPHPASPRALVALAAICIGATPGLSQDHTAPDVDPARALEPAAPPRKAAPLGMPPAVAGGCLGALGGAFAGGVLLGGGTFLVGFAQARVNAVEGATDPPEGFGLILISPVVGIAGVFAGGILGGLTGALVGSVDD